MADLSKHFTYVNDENITAFTSEKDNYDSKINFLGTTYQLYTHGNYYGVNPKNYYTQEEVDNLLTSYYSKTEVDTIITDLCTAIKSGTLINSYINEEGKWIFEYLA